MECVGLEVQCLEFRVWGAGCRVQGVGCGNHRALGGRGGKDDGERGVELLEGEGHGLGCGEALRDHAHRHVALDVAPA